MQSLMSASRHADRRTGPRGSRLVNAIAGGGSLISISSARCGGAASGDREYNEHRCAVPGYFWRSIRATARSRWPAEQGDDVASDKLDRGVVGALLLLWTGEKAFDILVPFLLLFAVALLAFQNQLQAFTMARKHGAHSETWSIAPRGNRRGSTAATSARRSA